MNRFYVDQKDIRSEDSVAVLYDKDEIKHLVKVLRLGSGDLVELCDGKGHDYLASIEAVDHHAVSFLIVEALESRELPLKVDLFQGVPKGQKWDYLIQKSVECGITGIYPVQMKRSVSKINEEKANKKAGRWQKIADGAAKQSKRSVQPLVHEAVSFSDALELLKEYDVVLVAYENEKEASLKDYEGLIKSAKAVAIVIGPEGGIADGEIDQLKEVAKIITLGKRILRTESAAMVLLSQISYIVE